MEIGTASACTASATWTSDGEMKIIYDTQTKIFNIKRLIILEHLLGPEEDFIRLKFSHIHWDLVAIYIECIFITMAVKQPMQNRHSHNNSNLQSLLLEVISWQI